MVMMVILFIYRIKVLPKDLWKIMSFQALCSLWRNRGREAIKRKLLTERIWCLIASKKKTLEVIKARLAFQATVREKFRGFTVAWILEMERIDAKRKLLRNGALKLSHGILRRQKDTWSMLMED